jgi:hypothetical protein
MNGKKFDQDKNQLITIPYTYWKNLYFRCFRFHSNNPTDREYLHVLKAMWDMAEWFQIPGKNFPEHSELFYDYMMYEPGQSPEDQFPDVMIGGAKKYGVLNWAHNMSWSRLASAYLRHGFAIYQRQKFDPESGLFHAAHMLANYTMLQSYAENRLPTDDRPFVISNQKERTGQGTKCS